MTEGLKLEKTILRKYVEKITGNPTFRGVFIDDARWSKEDLVLLCTLFANEMKEYQERYFKTLERLI